MTGLIAQNRLRKSRQKSRQEKAAGLRVGGASSSWPAAPATKFSSSPSLLTSTTRRCRPPPLSPAMQAARGEHSLSIATRDAEAIRKVSLLPSARSRPKPGRVPAVRDSAIPASQAQVAVHGNRGGGGCINGELFFLIHSLSIHVLDQRRSTWRAAPFGHPSCDLPVF